MFSPATALEKIPPVNEEAQVVFADLGYAMNGMLSEVFGRVLRPDPSG